VFDLGGRRSKKPAWILLGVVVIVVVVFFIPTIGGNLRYQTSSVFNLVFSSIGQLCTLFGLIFIVIGFVGPLLHKRLPGKTLVIGVLLLCIGVVLTGSSDSIFGGWWGKPGEGYHSIMVLKKIIGG